MNHFAASCEGQHPLFSVRALPEEGNVTAVVRIVWKGLERG